MGILSRNSSSVPNLSAPRSHIHTVRGLSRFTILSLVAILGCTQEIKIESPANPEQKNKSTAISPDSSIPDVIDVEASEGADDDPPPVDIFDESIEDGEIPIGEVIYVAIPNPDNPNEVDYVSLKYEENGLVLVCGDVRCAQITKTALGEVASAAQKIEKITNDDGESILQITGAEYDPKTGKTGDQGVSTMTQGQMVQMVQSIQAGEEYGSFTLSASEGASYLLQAKFLSSPTGVIRPLEEEN